MKKIFVIYFLSLLFSACINEGEFSSEVQNAKKPVVSTDSSSNVDFFNVKLYGTVELANGYEVTARGFILDTLQTMKGTGLSSDKGGKGNFAVNAEVKPGKIYYYRSYAVNKIDTAFGEIKSFQTRSTNPVIRTLNVANIKDGTADCFAVLDFDGFNPVEKIGICWGTSEVPTFENDSVTYYEGDIEIGKTVSVKIKGIRGGVPCYYRAYAVNADGSHYGEISQFSTPPIFVELEKFPQEEGRHFSATFMLGPDFYTVGGAGSSSESTYLDGVYVYGTDLQQWIPKTNFKDKRRGAVGFTIGDYGYVGFGHIAASSYRTDVYRYDQQESVWEETTPRIITEGVLPPVSYATSFSHDKNGYVIGGVGQSGQQYNQYVWRCSVDPDDAMTLIWERLRRIPVVSFKNAISFVFEDKAYIGLSDSAVVAGINYKYREIWEYDIKADRWTSFTYCPPEFNFGDSGMGTRAAATVITNGKAYFTGKDQIWELDLRTKEWAPKSVLPINRFGGNVMFSVGDVIYLGVNSKMTEFYQYFPLWDN
jgi:hypothetical protein